MKDQEISKSSIVEPRNIFDDEPEFTQWLSENLDYLEDVLGLSFEDAKPEESVGDFNCDIVASISDSDEKVIIENQFERTDHNHLGKIITYGAGQGAKCVIWISPEFRDEHKASLEWLNENTNENISFFGVKLEFIRIGESPVSPNFSVVVKPNDWTNKIRGVGRRNDLEKARYQFWEDVIEEYGKSNPEWVKIKPMFRNYLRYGRVQKIFKLVWEHYTSDNSVAVSILIKAGDSSKNREIYEELSHKKKEMEEELGEELFWDIPKTRYYISAYKSLDKDLENLDDSEKKILVTWMADTMKKMIVMVTKFDSKYTTF